MKPEIVTVNTHTLWNLNLKRWLLPTLTPFSVRMLVGYAMYNAYSISDYKDNTVEIYTNVIPQGNHKNINQYHLTGVDIIFSERAKSLIRTLELIEHGNSISEIDCLKYGEVRAEGLNTCSDVLFDEISKAIRYQYSTIVSLDLLLKDIGKEDALCIDIFQKNDIGNETLLPSKQ